MGGSLSVGAGGMIECAEPCPAGKICSHDVCLPSVPCKSDDDCEYDTYCDPVKGCLPWDTHNPDHDPKCLQVVASGVLAPRTQCEFSVPPMNDKFAAWRDVQGTPIVVNVNKSNNQPDNPGPGPSLIAASFTATVVSNYTEDMGIIRVISGKDCALTQNLGGVDLDGDKVVDYTVSSASLAAGDLNGDGYAEIVAFGADGSTLAFNYQPADDSWALLWKAPYPPGAPWAPCNALNHRCALGWAGPSIHDLDDDGKPEVIREGVVFSSAGKLVAMQPPGYASYSQGLFPVLANLDGDANIEHTNGQHIWQFANGQWAVEPYYPQANSPGLVAVANFGAYGNGLPETRPEIVVVKNGTVEIRAATGEVVFGPTPVPGGGSGGPPTVSDFDGDGLVEVGVAARGAYTVYDIDCGPSPRPGGMCPKGLCDGAGGVCPAGVAWSRVTQDISSSVTGSSIFDFEADGSSEVVYGDECFTRIYEGPTGKVLFSQFRSSCTWYENPIVADVDGDFRAELVVPSNKACSADGNGIPCGSLNANGVDPQYDGQRCLDKSECVSGVCDAGLCRCTMTAQCCGDKDDAKCAAQGFKCAPPEASGQPAKGNTCRASHPGGVAGLRVYADANDQWVPSRRIWNQHAYAITHVNENGTIPKTSQWKNNWEQPKLNNFRQNVPGDVNAQGLADATAGASNAFSCKDGTALLSVPICNRGALPMPSGVPVGFYLGQTKLCAGATMGILFPGNCEDVTCSWSKPPGDPQSAVDVKVVADDGNSLNECKEGNNIGGVLGVFCQGAK